MLYICIQEMSDVPSSDWGFDARGTLRNFPQTQLLPMRSHIAHPSRAHIYHLLFTPLLNMSSHKYHSLFFFPSLLYLRLRKKTMGPHRIHITHHATTMQTSCYPPFNTIILSFFAKSVSKAHTIIRP